MGGRAVHTLDEGVALLQKAVFPPHAVPEVPLPAGLRCDPGRTGSSAGPFLGGRLLIGSQVQGRSAWEGWLDGAWLGLGPAVRRLPSLGFHKCQRCSGTTDRQDGVQLSNLILDSKAGLGGRGCRCLAVLWCFLGA